MENLTAVSATIGGLLIGLSATIMLLFNGRITGISGITAGILMPKPGEAMWRVMFTAGLLLGGLAMLFIMPHQIQASPRSLPLVAIAGVLVGVGTRMGSGCTSGHGVCGLPRLSPRSLVAVVTFISTGAVAVALTRAFGLS